MDLRIARVIYLMRTFEEQISNYNVAISRGEEETTLVYNSIGKDTRTVYTSAPKTCKQNIKTKLIKLLGKEYKTDINNYVNTFFPRKKRVSTKKITEETQIGQLIKSVSKLAVNLDTLTEKVNKIENTMNLEMWKNLSINIQSFMALQTVPIPTQLEKVVDEPIINKEEPIIKKEEPIIKEEEPIIKEEEPIIKEEEPIIKEEVEEEEEEKEEEKEVEIIIEKKQKDIPKYNSTIILNNPSFETHKKRFNIKINNTIGGDIKYDPCEFIYNQHHQQVGEVRYITSTLINAPLCEYEGLLEDDNGEYIKVYTLYDDFAIGTTNIKGEYKPKTKYCKYSISSQNGFFQTFHNTREVLGEDDIKNQSTNCFIPKMKKRRCPEEIEKERNEMRDKFNNNNNTLVSPVC